MAAGSDDGHGAPVAPAFTRYDGAKAWHGTAWRRRLPADSRAPFECGEREVKIKNRGYTINVAATH